MVAVEKERKRQGNEIGSQWNVVAAAAVLSLHQVRMNLMKRELKQKQKQRQQQQKLKSCAMCSINSVCPVQMGFEKLRYTNEQMK